MEFWSMFQDYVSRNKIKIKKRKAYNRSLLPHNMGVIGAWSVSRVNPEKNQISVCCYLEVNIYEKMFAIKDQIEERTGFKFNWYAHDPGLRSKMYERSLVSISKECDFKNDFPNNMEPYYEWMCNVLLSLKKEVTPFARKSWSRKK